jgi:hypothetical protein
VKLLSIIVVVLASSVAAADPTYYVAPSLELGVNKPTEAVFAALSVDGGYHLIGGLWLHGKGVVGRSRASWGDGPVYSGNLDSAEYLVLYAFALRVSHARRPLPRAWLVRRSIVRA